MRHGFAYGGAVVLILVLLAVISFLVWPSEAGARVPSNSDSSDFDCIDANGNGAIDKAEVIVVINAYLFGPPAADLDCVDANGNGVIDKEEVIKAINAYLFGPSAGPKPTPAPTSTPLPEPTPTPGPTVTPRPSPTPSPAPARIYMLELINEERMKAEVPAVVLGSNAAAQPHAESMLANCFSSHWGTDGLKPYMRYSLTGRYQYNAENVSGLSYCITSGDGYRTVGVREGVRRAMKGLMNSPGHRLQILSQWHRKVNIGVAWDDYNIMIAQHFEGDYVEFDRLPSIEAGVLSFAGRYRNGVQFDEEKDLNVSLSYDPLPHALTPSQLARTYCYNLGRKVAAFRPPLEEGWTYTEDGFITTYTPCPSPHDVPSDTPPPASPAEAHDAWREARDASLEVEPENIVVPWATASLWTAEEGDLAMSADISEVLREHGSGVYTVLVWGVIDDADVPIAEYSIWVAEE